MSSPVLNSDSQDSETDQNFDLGSEDNFNPDDLDLQELEDESEEAFDSEIIEEYQKVPAGHPDYFITLLIESTPEARIRLTREEERVLFNQVSVLQAEILSQIDLEQFHVSHRYEPGDFHHEYHLAALLNYDLEAKLKERDALGVIPEGPWVEPEDFETLSDLAGQLDALYQKLINHNLLLVVAYARKNEFRAKKSGLNANDLVQQGGLSLRRAIDKYESERGLKFSTYAVGWIKQSMGLILKNQGRTMCVPVHVLDFLNKVRVARIALNNEGNFNPTVQQLAEHTGLSVEDIERVLVANKSSISLSIPIGSSGDTTFGALLTDKKSNDPAVLAAIREARDDIKIVLKSLRSTERDIIERRFGLVEGTVDKTLDEVGEDLGCTKERVRQIESKAMGKIADFYDLLSDMRMFHSAEFESWFNGYVDEQNSGDMAWVLLYLKTQMTLKEISYDYGVNRLSLLVKESFDSVFGVLEDIEKECGVFPETVKKIDDYLNDPDHRSFIRDLMRERFLAEASLEHNFGAVSRNGKSVALPVQFKDSVSSEVVKPALDSGVDVSNGQTSSDLSEGVNGHSCEEAVAMSENEISDVSAQSVQKKPSTKRPKKRQSKTDRKIALLGETLAHVEEIAGDLQKEFGTEGLDGLRVEHEGAYIKFPEKGDSSVEFGFDFD